MSQETAKQQETETKETFEQWLQRALEFKGPETYEHWAHRMLGTPQSS